MDNMLVVGEVVSQHSSGISALAGRFWGNGPIDNIREICMAPKIKYVRQETSRHGKAVFYYRRAGTRIRLPDPSSPNFQEALAAARTSGVSLHQPQRARPVAVPHKQLIEAALKMRAKGCRNRKASIAGENDITFDFLMELAEKQGYRCAMTGIRFFADDTVQSAKNPYAPSLDRIDPRKGYYRGNVRLVLFAVNVMLFDWGEAVVDHIAKAFLARKKPAPPSHP